MIDKSTLLQVIGILMKHPQYLSESDKYQLTPDDFETRFHKYLFIAIDSLYRNGATKIQPIDVENYLHTNDTAALIFKQQNGIEYLQDADYLSDEANFGYYYKKLKKFNLLTEFKKQGIDVSEWYIEDAADTKAIDVNSKFEQLEISDILASAKKKLLKIEQNYIQNDTTEVQLAFDGIEDILNEANEGTDIGVPIQGDIFNEVIAGARRGTFVLRSGGSGVSKTRQAVGDACYLAFPIRYSLEECKWVHCGNSQKVLFIATEQSAKEIQKMILAYLTGFNETRFRYGDFSVGEQLIIRQALRVMEIYQENFLIVRMPNPTIELVKNIVRENVLTHDIGYVFFDYIFISPSLIREFQGVALRNDEILLMFSTALKDLAVELNIFVMSSTQLNAKGDDNSNIRNEASLAGSRAVINKADVGAIMARPTKEELDYLKTDNGAKICPNIVTDIYKVRSGQWNQVRIWSEVNLGNLRKRDLFVTDARFNVININPEFQNIVSFEDFDVSIVNEINSME